VSLYDRVTSSTGDGSAGVAEAPAGQADQRAELKARVHQECVMRLGPELAAGGLAESEQAQKVIEAAERMLILEQAPLSREERSRLVREIAYDVLGYGPLQPFLADPTVTEVMVNGPRSIFVERHGMIERVGATFAGDAHLLRIIDKIVSQVGRRVDEASPMVDARLPDGSRVNVVLPPLALDGATLTIRKFSREPYTIDDLVRFGTLGRDAADFLAACVRGKLNVLVSGGAGVGKTTLLNALSKFVPDRERIITIEDAAEIQLQQAHVVRLEMRPPNVEGRGEVRIRDLVRNALRMRPDRIIVGEVRGAEAVDMLQAMNTGHEGSLTTIHANSPRDAIARLETLVMTGGVEMPLRAIREQIANAFDLVLQLSRGDDGVRRVTHVTELVGMESETVTTQDLWSLAGGRLEPTGLQPHCLARLSAHGAELPESSFGISDDVFAWSPRGTGGHR